MGRGSRKPERVFLITRESKMLKFASVLIAAGLLLGGCGGDKKAEEPAAPAAEEKKAEGEKAEEPAKADEAK